MITIKSRLFVTLLILALTATANISFSAEAPKEKALKFDQTQVQLSLEDVSRLALLNNFDIQLAQYDAYIARTDKGVAQSFYDTILKAEVKYRDNQAKQSSNLVGTKILENEYNFSATKKLPTGTKVTLEADNVRNWSNSSFATLNPAHDSSLKLEISQDLGKNFFGLNDRGDVKVTLIDIENSEYTSFDKILGVITDVQSAYWDLVASDEVLEYEGQMVALAKELYDLNQDKVVDGLVELPDVLASEANYQEQLNNFLLAQNERNLRENILRLMINITEDQVKIQPTDEFLISDVKEDLTSSLAKAFENRFDYKKARRLIDSKEIKLAMKKNSLWPEINLTASFAQNGVEKDFKQAVEQITKENNPDLRAELSVSFPLENRDARARLKAAQLEKAQALIALKKIEREIAVGIMDQVKSCNVYQQLALNAHMVADLHERKLDAEKERFLSGRSDTDTIIRFQRELNLARINSARAKNRYYAAVIELRKREGTLLNTYWKGDL